MLEMQEALQTFVVESRELLENMEQALLQWTDGGDGFADSINAIFRAAHTIKGSAGLFGLDFLVEFTHVVESVLDRVRDGDLPMDEALVGLMLGCCDHIGTLVEAAADGATEADAALLERGQPLLAALNARLGVDTSAAGTTAPTSTSAADTPAGGHWHLSLRFGADVLRSGMDPMSFVRYLRKLGTVEGIVLIADQVPPLAELDPECCHLGLEIGLRSAADRSAIEGTFEFVRDDCVIRILPPGTTRAEFQALIDADENLAASVADALVRCGSIARLAPAAPTTMAIGHTDTDTELAADPTPTPPASIPTIAAAHPARTASKAKESRPGEVQSVRVDADKLDRLIDLVGELITAAATATAAGQAVPSTPLREAHSILHGLVQEIRDSALQLRMVRIGGTFARFKRVVHDVARELGKDIELVVSGEETELDKTVVERIADPLTHLVRNSMDHGIEPSALRLERGKPAGGTVTLNAYHDSGSVVIEVGDDGGGLDRDRILAKAVERGLVDPTRALTDAEIYGLIFEPGFSTAAQVTNLSGRGVGMDVVKRNITALRGAVSVDSRPGLGTTVRVRLPLTLAIINGFQVAVGASVFVLPLDVVEECVELKAEHASGHDYAELRGQVLPFIRLHEMFRIPPLPNSPSSARPSIVVVRQGGQRFGLIVDRLLGEAQTVIKPLARIFADLPGISGSSILGSGDVALILDVPALAARAVAAAAARVAAPSADASPYPAARLSTERVA